MVKKKYDKHTNDMVLYF